MPSSEETYFNIKRMHWLFAISSLALLAVTVWMLAADHWREWKIYQSTYRDRVEPWLTAARLAAEQSQDYFAREQELTSTLAQANSALGEQAVLESFCKQVEADAKRREVETPDFAGLEAARGEFLETPSEQTRLALLAEFNEYLDAARFREQDAQRRLRFRKADFDEARSEFEAAVGDGAEKPRLEKLQARVDEIKADVDRFEIESQSATEHVSVLEIILRKADEPVLVAQKELADHRAGIEQLRRTLTQQHPSLTKDFLRLPVIDAFGRPLAVEQIWLPELTIDYNFQEVARFDRCVTCHQGSFETKAGKPSEGALAAESIAKVKIVLGGEDKEDRTEGNEENEEEGNKTKSTDLRSTLVDEYGMHLATEGMICAEAPTVGMIVPLSPAAKSDLAVGDVILSINGKPVESRADAERILLALATGETEETNKSDSSLSPLPSVEENDKDNEPQNIVVELEVRRGLKHPYQSHPRMNLFVSSMSPHPGEEFGCTICHDGQGSATTFKFASHSPNDPEQRRRWKKEHDWFFNQHWDFPMLPKRFSESRCLKCHHDVSDLEPSERFRQPPAPKLMAGYHLVRENGCFCCHEIKGVSTSGRSIGPDMRLESGYCEAALQLQTDPALDDKQRKLAATVVARPEEQAARQTLVESFNQEQRGKLNRHSQALLDLLGCCDPAPGTMRKVGPSLRGVADRLDTTYIQDWTANSTRFKPSTRMPHFFGLHDHLDGRRLEEARRFETVELAAVARWLLDASQNVEPAPLPSQVTEAASAERGKALFEIQGCLACHKHADFPQSQGTQGPDLTGLGTKYIGKKAAAWLVDWIRDPARHAPRTVMPNAMLEPVQLPVGKEKNDAKPRYSYPPADIAAYLLSSSGPKPERPPAVVENDLDELALQHLSKTFPRAQAERFLAEGIPEAMAASIQDDAVELLGKVSNEKKLRYVGRRTIAKRGCYACHDIPTFELAQPIGPQLSDWGRKQESLLAFGQVHRFNVLNKPETADNDSDREAEKDTDQEFYKEALRAHRREGFLWQKLRAPRSFDYKIADNKDYNEQLTMGRFGFSPQESEAIATFILGLVAEPPAQKYVYSPKGRRRAIVEGRKIIDKYACASCHAMEMERWKIRFDPKFFEPPEASEGDYDFLAPRILLRQIDESKTIDRRGLVTAELVGMPVVGDDGKPAELEGDEEDEDGEPLPMRAFSLWEPAVINGEECRVGGADVLVYDHQILERQPPLGGEFARLLYPVAFSQARAAGANVAGMEAWGWGPPPLANEGEVVQPAWLHDYLLNPTQIRPAAVLRMPKYNMSADEAGKLVDYFAAKSKVPYPYASSAPGSATSDLAEKEKQHPKRLDNAMRIVTDRKTYCAKCHLVGDFNPGGETKTTLAPNLDEVGRRILPDYIRRWLANPKAAVPYTGMPVNFPPEGNPLGQDLFKGSSLEQLDAVTDLLINYDRQMSQKTSIRTMIEETEKAEARKKAEAEKKSAEKKAEAGKKK
ncbi:MAG: c-type cytochrome [Pirellulales bacterium]|nr:c-type cytochrome [Pirellulales bacterium]